MIRPLKNIEFKLKHLSQKVLKVHLCNLLIGECTKQLLVIPRYSTLFHVLFQVSLPPPQYVEIPYRSGVSCFKDMAVKLSIGAAWVMGDEGKLGINRTGGGQRDSSQSVSHEEGLWTRRMSPSQKKKNRNVNAFLV